MKPFRIAMLQTKCTLNKEQNIKILAEALEWSAGNKANVCLFGQTCNTPYSAKYLHSFAQPFEDSPTLSMMKQACQRHKMYAIGSIPRISLTKQYFNTAFVINPLGQLHAQMDKMHLFDIDIPTKITYKQSAIFRQGNDVCVFDTEYCRMGLAVCYDLRFAELGLLMRQKGAHMLVYPGSFNHTTGPLHYELLLRGRALDNQCFVAGVSTAQYKQDPSVYQAWGHSTLVDPFAKVLLAMDENQSYQVYDIDPAYALEVREQIPIGKQKRNDIYSLREVEK